MFNSWSGYHDRSVPIFLRVGAQYWRPAVQYLATALPVSIARAKEVIENFMMDDRLFLGDTESRE